MKTADFRIPHGDRNVGTFHLPDDVDSPVPVMIVCHGWGGDRTPGAFREQLRDRLPDRGMAAVTFDFFGCGDTGGPYGEMTYGRWTSNLADIFSWVSEQAWADATRIGCLGISSGSTAALRFGRQTQGVAFVVSVATCLGLYISMPNSPARTFARDAERLLAGERANIFGAPFPLEFFRDLIEHAPIYDVAEIACPVLFLEGTEDNPFRRSDGWLGHELRRRSGAASHHIEIEGGNHGLGSRAQESTDVLLSWLRSIGMLAAI